MGRYVFPEETKLGTSVIPVGASVTARVAKDAQGQLGLFTDEPLYAGNTVIPKGSPASCRFQIFAAKLLRDQRQVNSHHRAGAVLALHKGLTLRGPLSIDTVPALSDMGFRLARSLSARAGLRYSVHALSSISFVLGAMFAYYVIFPPAAKISAGTWSRLSTAAKGRRLL